MLRELWTWMRFLFRGKTHADVDEELGFHLERQVEANVAAGMSREEAQRQAAIAFGGVERAREACREERPGYPLEALGHDFRFAMRGFRRNPAFSLTVVVTLMLGIGSTTAVMSVVDRILFRPLPYGDAGRLVSVGLVAPIEPQEFMLGGSYYEWQDNQKPFTALTSEIGTTACDLTETNPLRLDCAGVEANFLPTLGVMPAAGRNFLPSEDRPNAPKVALISYGLWKSRFHLDAGAVGRVIQLDGAGYEVVGVLPRDFEMPRLQAADILVPERLDVAAQRRADPGRPMWAFARLKPGITPEQAHAQLEPLFDYSLRLAPAPFRKEVHYTVRPLRDRQFHDVRRAAWVLLGLVMAVLLIACANVASLMTARRASREREIAVRSALGAGRMRLLRQAMTESLVLSVAGGAAGALFAVGLLRLFVAMAPEGMPFLSAARIDVRILGFAMLVSVAAAAGFGLVSGSSRARAEALTSRSAVSLRHARLRQALVMAQIAMSLLLLAGGALLAKSFWNLQRQDLGLNDQNVVTATITLGQTAYPTGDSQRAFFAQLQRSLAYGPGVLALAVSDSLPPGGHHGEQIYASLRVEGRPRLATGTGGNITWRWVTPDYFRALGIPLIEGGGFTEDEVGSSNRFVVLSRSLAARMFPGQNPVGQQIHMAAGAPADQDPVYTVVGVAADVKNGGLAVGDEPEYYRLRRNRAEDWNRSGVVIVKSSLPAGQAEQWLRGQIATLDPTLPAQISTMNEQVRKMADQPRFEMLLVGYFACAGLVLAIVGLYGVTAFLMVQRRPEMGIRMALGANRADIVRLVLGSAMRMVLPGTLLGLALALGVSRVLGSLLFGVDPRDPVAFLGVTALLEAVALVAALIPASAAARVDPNFATSY
jgi:predicted permease